MSGCDRIFFSSPKHPYLFWGPSSMYQSLFISSHSGCGTQLTVYCHLVRRLWMSVAVLSVRLLLSWPEQTNFPYHNNLKQWVPYLTFTARASYRLGRHLNISALPEVRASHTLGQPQPQPFKYFVLHIFRDISLILSTTLEGFPASCSDWSTHWEKTTCIHFYTRLFVHNQ